MKRVITGEKDGRSYFAHVGEVDAIESDGFVIGLAGVVVAGDGHVCLPGRPFLPGQATGGWRRTRCRRAAG